MEQERPTSKRESALAVFRAFHPETMKIPGIARKPYIAEEIRCHLPAGGIAWVLSEMGTARWELPRVFVAW
jgi:hypothetical protein